MTATMMRRPGGAQRIDYKKAEMMLRSGATQQEVADLFGVTQGAIAAAIRRGVVKYKKGRPADRAMPWSPIREEHRQKYLARMLRAAHRRESGMENAPPIERMLDSFLRDVEERDYVVTYEPDTEEGFFRVPRRHGIDEGLVREPDINDDGTPKRQRRKP